jgi:hypothetical protein
MLHERLVCQCMGDISVVIISIGIEGLLAVGGTRLMEVMLWFIGDELPRLSPM